MPESQGPAPTRSSRLRGTAAAGYRREAQQHRTTGGALMGHPIHVVGDRPRDGYFYLSDELVRAGARELGSDGFVLLAYLLSRAGTSRGKRFETAPIRISGDLGWGRNRERVRRAVAVAAKEQRLVIRRFERDGRELATRWTYVVAAGGRKFTDAELSEYSRPTVLQSKMRPKGAQ